MLKYLLVPYFLFFTGFQTWFYQMRRFYPHHSLYTESDDWL